MNRCGTQEVELYDGRMIGLDPTTADRLDNLLGTAPDTAVEEVMKLCLSITGARAGWIELPSQQWVTRFNGSIGNLLRASELHLMTGSGGRSLYELRHMESKKQRQSHKDRVRVHG